MYLCVYGLSVSLELMKFVAINFRKIITYTYISISKQNLLKLIVQKLLFYSIKINFFRFTYLNGLKDFFLFIYKCILI